MTRRALTATLALFLFAAPAAAQSSGPTSVPTLRPILVSAHDPGRKPVAQNHKDPIAEMVERYRRTGREEVLKQSDDGSYAFGYEEATMSCTILRQCAIELQEGEQVYYARPADPRWTSKITRMGVNGATPVILVQPKYQQTTTNMVITTNKRMYNVTLDSPPVDESEQNPQGQFLHRISFFYPDERIREQQNAIREAQARQVEASRSEVFAGLSVSDINLNYRYSKDSGFPWRPKGVFSADGRVYIQVPDDLQEYPLLFEVGPAGELREMNYPPPSERGAYVTDREFDKAVLMVGVNERSGPFSFLGIGKKSREKQTLEIIRTGE